MGIARLLGVCMGERSCLAYLVMNDYVQIMGDFYGEGVDSIQ